MNNRIKAVLIISAFTLAASAQTWIWYPGDYEIWLGNKMNNRRTERGAFFPPFWKTDTHYPVVEFSRTLNLQEAEEVHIAVEGTFNIKLDGKLQFGMPSTFSLPAGVHKLNIKVWNQTTPPALYVHGKTVKSDSNWKVTFEDKEWIDESGKASSTSATHYADAGYWNFNRVDQRPSVFCLDRTPIQISSKSVVNGGVLYDFGKETFGYVTLKGLKGKGILNIYYGESPEEALDKEHCETLDKLQLDGKGQIKDLATNQIYEVGDAFTLSDSKAFRYVFIVPDAEGQVGDASNETVKLDDVSMMYEYLPENYRGSFKCNDEEINRIWEVGAYTMHLTTREFFIDGIKRDRWVWSGDAIQSYLMNYYLFFDSESVKRTIWLLRGKDPVTSHINTIMDYTFYWFMSIYDYYQYTGDRAFVAQLYPQMQSLMDYVLRRTNTGGMVEGLSGDWVFVDWADGYLDKKGELSFEQMLFCKSLETMALCAAIAGEKEDEGKFTRLASTLKGKLESTFWNSRRNAFVHNVVDGKQSDAVTRYSNMFSILFDYVDTHKKQQIKKNVLENDSILKITTPYMRFYELAALCALGEQKNVLREIKSYWGGMLREGATSFWEKYNPDESGKQHLAMYGRPYGKSLCHAWGASPIYLLGKYYLGVEPVKPGYEEFSVKPALGGLRRMEGAVPTPHGDVHVYMDGKTIRVKADSGSGYLYVHSRKVPVSNFGKAEKIAEGHYRIAITSGKEYMVKYWG